MNEREVIEAFQNQRIAVLGDIMLDEYLWGDVNRISPEAPVPVVVTKRRTHIPGGASNVAANIASLEGVVHLGGVVGADEAAGFLRRILAEKGVNASGVVAESDRPTTTKTRILAHNQQMLRIDSESVAPLTRESEENLLIWWKKTLPDAKLCVLSDYNKGVLSLQFTQKLIEEARAANLKVIVDPKGIEYEKYRGASLITPNTLEAEKATGIEICDETSLFKAAEKLHILLPGTVILITLGAKGMAVFIEGEPSFHIPAVTKTVYDVTGAGDTVVGVLALSLAAGASAYEAAKLANRAAGLVVAKLGTSCLQRSELLGGN